MEVKPITEIIGHRIVGTGIFCTYGIEHLNDSIIEVIQDYMKDRQTDGSIIDVYNNSIDIHYCGEEDLDYIDDYFNLERLKSNGVEEIHNTYQKLRDKKDIIRNNLMLIDTRIPHEYNMKHKQNNDLKSDKIRIINKRKK